MNAPILRNADADRILRARAGVTLRTAVDRILTMFDLATAADIESGATWYGSDAAALVSDLAHVGGVSRETAAAVLSKLSPRTTWGRNVAAATALLGAYGRGEGIDAACEAARAVGAMNANVLGARAAVVAYVNGQDPLLTFGATAPKTGAFARNLLGDRDAVTVDVWAARIALVPSWSRGQETDADLILSRAGVYGALAHAYRVAARRRGVDPTTMQATTWVVVRNGRAG